MELNLTKFDKTAESRRTLHTHTHTHTCSFLLSKCKNCACNFCEKFFKKTKLIFATLVVAIFYAGAYATTDIQPNGNLAGGNTAANCTQPVLGTYSGSTNFEAKWRANTVPLKWYNRGTQLSVEDAASTCTYDGVLNIPATPPSRTGYTFGGWKIKPGLPSGYTRLEYIQSSGTQYINTGHIHAVNDTYEIDVMVDSVDTAYRSIIGAAPTGSSNYFYVSKTTSGVWFCNVSKTGSSVPLQTRVVLKFVQNSNNAEMFLNGVSQYTAPVTSFGLPVMLLARNATEGKAMGKLYGAKIYNNENIVIQDLIPVKNSSNVVGMYDTVSQTFFTNAGSGTFTAGPELN